MASRATYAGSGEFTMDKDGLEHQTSVDSSIPSTGGFVPDHPNGVWPKLQVLKERYLEDLKRLYGMLSVWSRMDQAWPPEQTRKLERYKDILYRMIPLLTISKESVPSEFTQDKLESLEKQIVSLMETFKRRTRPSIQQPALPPQQKRAQASQIQQQSKELMQRSAGPNGGEASTSSPPPNTLAINLELTLQPSSIPSFQESGADNIQPTASEWLKWVEHHLLGPEG